MYLTDIRWRIQEIEQNRQIEQIDRFIEDIQPGDIVLLSHDANDNDSAALAGMIRMREVNSALKETTESMETHVGMVTA